MAHQNGAPIRCKDGHHRGKPNQDITWLRDESLEDSDSLPDPAVLAAEIMEDLQAALEAFGEGMRSPSGPSAHFSAPADGQR